MMGSESLFYLLGFQRSGTTLLCHLLDRHPDVLCVDEPELSKLIVFGKYDVLQNVHFPSLKGALDFYSVKPEEFTELAEKYVRQNIDADMFLRRSYHLFNRKGARREGVKEVCDLTSFRYQYLRKLISFHGNDVKFVFIERDIKGVVNSFVKLGFFTPGKRKITDWNMKQFAKKYVQCVNDMEKLLPRGNTYYLTFEDFMRHPEEKLKDIFSFLNVDFSLHLVRSILDTPSQGIRQNYKGLRKGIPSGWQENLNEKQINWLEKLYEKKRVCNKFFPASAGTIKDKV